MKLKKILVIGGLGYIGSHTLKYFNLEEFDIEVIDIGIPENKIKGIQYSKGNILDFDIINTKIHKSDIIFNFAAISNIEICNKNPSKAIQLNIQAINNIALTCSKYKKRLVQASSVYSLSNHGGIYSITKRTAEELIIHYHKEYNLSYTILRYGTIYGPNEGQGNSLLGYIKQALVDKEICYNGSGKETREYIHIEDAARLTAEIVEDIHNNQVLMITGIHPYKVTDIFDLVKEILDNDIKIILSEETSKFHYKTSPSNFREIVAQKIISNKYIDINQGVLEIVNNLKL